MAMALALPGGAAQAATATLGSPLPPAASSGGPPDVLALPDGVVWLYNGSSVLRSTDTGTSWSRVFPNWAVTPTSLRVEGAYFLAGRDAWAVTSRQWPAQPGSTTVLRTTDGGAQWEEGVSLPGPLSYGEPGFDEFSFADAGDGFGFGVSSSGAGASVALSYIESAFPPTVLSMSFPNATTGFVLGTAPGTPLGSQMAPVNLIKTTDGGGQWALVTQLR